MEHTDKFASFRVLLEDFVLDPANGYLVEGREVESINTSKPCVDFWTVRLTYKEKQNVKPSKLNWLLKAGPDRATFNIFVEEVAGWMWLKTQQQIKSLCGSAGL